MTKKALGLLLVVALVCAPLYVQGSPARRSVVGFFFDTVVVITAYANDDSALDEALTLCASFEKRLSKTIEGSDVWNINRAGGQAVEVSDDTISILETAQAVSDMSGGVFDVTIAPAVSLWNFKPENGEGVLPDAADVDAAASLADYTRIQIDENRVTLPEGMQIDLGGVAKGYIADQIAGFLRGKGIQSAILNFGGNVVALGDKPDGSMWSVGIQDPNQPTGYSLFAIPVDNMSVVTSGIYERGFDLDGVRYHHLLDPKTGWPAQNELASATILTDSSALADALSTATFVLGLKHGLALIESIEGVEALLITRAGDVVATTGAQALLGAP